MIRLPLIHGSEAWIDARIGLPTASQFGKIVTPKTMKLSAQADSYRNALLAEWVLGYSVVDAESGFMDRGSDMEADAHAWYELQTDNEIEPAGFILTDDRRVGGSPDGFVADDGIVEIKCPSAVVHIGYLLDGIDEKYRAQYQGYLWLTGRAWVDMISYSPVLPSVIVRVTRDEAFMTALGPALTQFCEMLDAGKRMLAARGLVGAKGLPPIRGIELVA